MNRRAVAVNGDRGAVDRSVGVGRAGADRRAAAAAETGARGVAGGTGDIRLQGTVAWAIAVPSGGSIQYRAGVEFVNADKKQLTTYCEKYGGTPDPTTTGTT